MTIAAIIELGIVLTLLAGGAGGLLVLRAKHRQLFARIQNLNTRLRRLEDDQLLVLRDDVRVLQRLRRVDAILAAAEDGEPGTASRSEIDPFTSQSREDILIFDFFERRGPGFFIEAGAYDGVSYSTTYLLERIGWRGLLVEPIPHKAESCCRNRPRSHVVQAALGSSNSDEGIEFTFAEDPRGGGMLSFLQADKGHIERCRSEQCELQTIRVPMRTLNNLLDGLTQTVDFLSLDLEGAELDALRGFDIAKFTPKMILLERQEGPRDEDLARYLSEHSYVRSAVKGSNYFFVHKDYLTEFLALICDDERIPVR